MTWQKVEQPDLLKLIALVSDQEVGHTLVQKDCIEVVVPEEDCQLIGLQAFPQRRQAMVCQLARAAVQKVLQTWCEAYWDSPMLTCTICV